MSTSKPGDGGCQCGNIRYQLGTDKPRTLYVCHCTDCQKQSASAFGMSLSMDASQVEFVLGQESLRSWDTRAEDGQVKRCHFCPDCGTRLMHGSDSSFGRVSIKAGSLDDTSKLQPAAHIWLQSAQPWVNIDREKYLCFDTEPDDSLFTAGES